VLTPLDWVLYNFSSWRQTTFVKLPQLVLQSEWDINIGLYMLSEVLVCCLQGNYWQLLIWEWLE
jgi:hypothetical protein